MLRCCQQDFGSTFSLGRLILWHKTVLQEDISGGNTNLFKKSPWYYSLQKKPKWVPLNGANGWELRAQWNILSKYYDILAKYLTVLSNLSRQHHSAVTQFGFFGQVTNVGFFWKDFFFRHKCTLKHFNCLIIPATKGKSEHYN